METKYWLSYGAGVNSTALAILLTQNKVLGISENWSPIFADTGNEKDETYRYLEEWARPWFEKARHPLITVRGQETVLERWQRYSMIGSRVTRACTDKAKIIPINNYVKLHGGGHRIIGIDADEAHRVKRNGPRAPLVEMNIGRDDCAAIIEAVDMPVPVKSGCWHCPFMRVSEVLELARKQPAKFAIIEDLENSSIKKLPPQDNVVRAQWGQKAASYWRKRAMIENCQIDFLEEKTYGSEICTGCYDG